MEGSVRVQQVTKKSSDELLRKFAGAEEEEGEEESHNKKHIIGVGKRRKRNNMRAREVDEFSTNSIVERRSLLPQATRKLVIPRQRGIGRPELKARDLKNKSILVAIEKTWRRTLEGASRVLLDKQYNRHKRLISDVV